MKQYDVYGLGNALLDMEICVTENELAGLQIDKGVMTLIDEDRHHCLVNHFSTRNMLKACGGSAANTMIAIQQLGCQGFYSCKVASDESGAFYLKDLISHGLDTNLESSRLTEGITGKCLVMVTGDADRTMNTHLGITNSLSRHELNQEAIEQSSYLYIEGYLVTSDTGRAAAIKAYQIAKKANVPVALTLSDPNMTQFFADGLKEMIGNGVDILFCNQAEAELFTGETELAAIGMSLKTFAMTFIITRGKDGALLFDGSEYHHIAGIETNVKDTLGAGDMFAGSYLAYLSKGDRPHVAANKANIAAARIVSKFGPRLNTEEVRLLRTELEMAEHLVSA